MDGDRDFKQCRENPKKLVSKKMKGVCKSDS